MNSPSDSTPHQDASGPAPGETQDQHSSTPAPGRWQRFVGALKKTTATAGKGIQAAYTVSQEQKHYLLPALNGLVGDKLAAANDRLAIRMSFRVGDEDVDVARLSFAPGATTVVVFVHGLMADDVLWHTPTRERSGYGPDLTRDLGVTVLYVRYNTGRHISQNGRALADLLEELMRVHGASIKKLVLVAHSMGGLVSRSAGYYGSQAGHRWIRNLAAVVLIGVPNDGSFVASAGHLTAFVLRNIWTIPTKIIASIADERSDGIKDLRIGLMVDEDWPLEDPRQLLHGRRTEVPPLPGVRYHVIAGTLGKDAGSPLAVYFGDGLVGKSSANGSTFYRVNAAADDFLEFRVFPTTNHVTLLLSDEVYAYIKNVVQTAV